MTNSLQNKFARYNKIDVGTEGVASTVTIQNNNHKLTVTNNVFARSQSSTVFTNRSKIPVPATATALRHTKLLGILNRRGQPINIRDNLF